jgi:hypothetical protein
MNYSAFAIFFSIFLASGFPVSADLQIVGGTQEQHTALTQTYVNTIPNRFHSKFKISVQLLDDAAMNRYLNDGNDSLSASKDADDTVDGVYEDGPPLITLRSSRPINELEYTIAHEYGHYVWQTQLTSGLRKAYNRIYDSQKSMGQLVSDYSSFSVNEGFAEAFATYATCPKLLKAKDSRSYFFIDTLTAKLRAQ